MLPEVGRRYALCVGIGHHTALTSADSISELPYAVPDAESVAALLRDPQRGNFTVTLLTKAEQTTQRSLVDALTESLNAPDLKPEDMVVIYFACHGMTYGTNRTFCILPSDGRLKDDIPNKLTVIENRDIAKALANAKVKNIIFLLDVCYSGGVGSVLQHLDFQRELYPDTNLAIIAAAMWNQSAYESSRVHHGIFTDCLLKACEQKPTRDDGWLTIKEIGSFLTKNARSYITASQISIPEILITTDELLMVKNPRFSPQSKDFYEHIQMLLTLVQYEPIKTTLSEEPPAGFYQAELKFGLDNTQTYGIFPYYNEIEALTNEEVQKIVYFLEKQIKQGKLQKGMLVTKKEVGNEVKALLSSHPLEVRTEKSIWKKLIDFEKYLQKLVELYEKPSDWSKHVPLKRVYIPLNAERRQHGDGTTWQGDLEGEVRRWLADPDSKHSSLALLASYGSGKTTFCRYMAAKLAEEYFDAKNEGDHTRRIPLWVPLQSFSKAPVDLNTFLEDYLKQYCKVSNPSAEALLKMAEAGLIFFMLDGFDEMMSQANTITVEQNMLLFDKLIELSDNKVLLTTRPEYLVNRDEEQQILGPFPLLSLQPLNDQQVALYLQKRVPSIEKAKDWQYYRDKIQAIPGLSNLVHRPVLLEIIVKTLPTLIVEGKVVNRPNLYQRYLEEELKRQLAKQRRDMLIDSQQHFAIIERIALELYRTNAIELTSSKIREISNEILTSEQRNAMDSSLRETLACSFLNRVDNSYCFSHPSFLDYLIARRLAQDIAHNDQKMFGQKQISTTIRDFLLEFEIGMRQRSTDNATLAGMDNTVISFEYKTLEKWFREPSMLQLNFMNKWTGRNTISLLVKLMPHELFSTLPLGQVDLSRMDFSEDNLTEIDFNKLSSGAMISRIEWQFIGGAIGLVVYGWEGVITGMFIGDGVSRIPAFSKEEPSGKEGIVDKLVDKLILQAARLNESDFNKANLNSVNFRRANLRGASLIMINLRGADLRGADLRGADLRGTDLRGADLRGADLRGTRLKKAQLGEAKIEKEKLDTKQKAQAVWT